MRVTMTVPMLALSALAACGPDASKAWRGTENGEAIYEYTVQHWPTALWSERKLEAWIRQDGTKLCPQGYREIARTPGSSHVYYGSPIAMPYNDVIVKIACKGAEKLPAVKNSAVAK